MSGQVVDGNWIRVVRVTECRRCGMSFNLPAARAGYSERKCCLECDPLGHGQEQAEPSQAYNMAHRLVEIESAARLLIAAYRTGHMDVAAQAATQLEDWLAA